jgi:hypothetical protein
MIEDLRPDETQAGHELKKCSNCFKLKPVSEFYTRRTGDGRQSRCKECNREVVAGYRERARGRMRDEQ